MKSFNHLDLLKHFWYNDYIKNKDKKEMESFEPKKLALLRILQILEYYSDADHQLKQEDIAKRLSSDYGIDIERKAIGRNLSLLKEAGIEIESTRNGCYLAERTFEDSELRLLIDGVLSSKHITAKHSKQLIEKLCSMSNKYFKNHVKNVYSVNDWSKSENVALFYNIEIVDEAIEKGKQIKFDYNKYGADKVLHKSATHIASPYQLILHNQRYYLMALNEKWKNLGYYRVDHITNMELTDAPLTPIRSVPGYESGINYKAFNSSLPYMFTDKIETITFLAGDWVIDQVVDWFGFDSKIEKVGDKFKVTVRVSPNAMEYWAMQYLNAVEIIEPLHLRERIKKNVEAANEKYKD